MNITPFTMSPPVVSGRAPKGPETPRQSIASVADRFEPKFAAKITLSQPTTTAESRFVNERVSLDPRNMVLSLVEKLDEIMTVTGETYSKNEAFTTLIDMQLPEPQALVARHGRSGNARLEAKVDHTLNAGRAQNVGIMVMSSSAKDELGRTVATARATFNAIDPESVKVGALKPAPVTLLSDGSADANTWNGSLSGFYKGIATRLGAKDPNAPMPNLAELGNSSSRLVNTNVYVTPQMLNKKKTGHGGIAAGMAVKDMEALVQKLTNPTHDPNVKAFPVRLSANYLDKFVESDALQFDTTLDHVDPQGNFVLSSRIYKLDTKQQTAQGPVILVHAKFKAGVSVPGIPIQQVVANNVVVNTDADAAQRAQDAVTWAQLPA